MPSSSLARATLLALALSMGMASVGTAQTPPDDDNAMAFRAVEGGGEDVDGGALMVAAYGTILVLILGYVLYLARIQAGTSAELVRLRAAVEKARGYRDRPAVDTAKPGDEPQAKSTAD